jgi:hypothetical protein
MNARLSLDIAKRTSMRVPSVVPAKCPDATGLKAGYRLSLHRTEKRSEETQPEIRSSTQSDAG